MLGDLQELLRPCFREKFRECCCQLTSRGYLWPCAIAFLKVMLSKVIERHLGSPVLHSASGLPTVTKSHDALTSGPPAHRFAPLPAGVTGITAQLVQSLGTLLERSHYSHAWRASAMGCASPGLSKLTCPVLLTLPCLGHLTPRISDCFTSSLLRPSNAILLLYFHTGSPSTVDLKFKLLYNTRVSSQFTLSTIF